MLELTLFRYHVGTSSGARITSNLTPLRTLERSERPESKREDSCLRSAIERDMSQPNDGRSLPELVAVMQRLLGEGGCPWDREQTHATLRKYVLEEACEVMDAIDELDDERAPSAKSAEHLREELGDLLLQIVFHAELARQERAFGIDDVVAGIVDKMVRRHPHVFGAGEQAEALPEVGGSAKQVLENWEILKARERKDRGVLEGLPRSLPALVRALRIGEKVARVGFDWPNMDGSRAKVSEEIAELDAAIASGSQDRIEAELGDVLFALANLARHVGVDPEAALRRTSDEFTARFSHVESRVREHHGGFSKGALPLAQLDEYWDEAKRLRAALEPT